MRSDFSLNKVHSDFSLNNNCNVICILPVTVFHYTYRGTSMMIYRPAYSTTSKDQPGKIANPARGQLNRENKYFPAPVRA